MELIQDLWAQAMEHEHGKTVVIAGAGSLLLCVLALCRIYAKVGHHPAMGLLLLVPGVNALMLMTLAFGRWPIERELRELRSVRNAVHKADQKALRRAA